MNFAKKYENEQKAFQENILFTDESKFELFGVKKPKKCVAETVKHGGGSVMVCGCTAASGVGNLQFMEPTTENEDYLSILQQNVTPSIEKLSLDGNWRKLDISTG